MRNSTSCRVSPPSTSVVCGGNLDSPTRWLAFILLLTIGAHTTRANDLASTLQQQGFTPQPFDFHGYAGWEFSCDDGVLARIVEPKQTAAGCPWIWRARFWGHQPALDVALLKRGFHLAYCDVADLYGAPEAVARWDRFYELTQRLDWHPRPILEGMSRGGLIVFNWAKAHPGRVGAIYADNPVCDIRTWPKNHSPTDWQKCQAAYGIGEGDLATFAGNPIDHLDALAKAGVPVFLVVGEDDQVVPIASNALVLADRYRDLGGNVRQWVKPDAGHHPHGLHPVEPLLHSLLAATGRVSTAPLPMELLTDSQRILMLGDSITYGGDYIAHFAAWAERRHGVPADRFVNLGLPSETASGLSEPGHAGGRFPRPDLHERLQRVLDHVQPDVVFACYGMNCGIQQPLDNDRFAKYQTGLRRLHDVVATRGATAVLITPPTFDAMVAPDRAFYADVLDHYADWVIGQEARDWKVIDVHYPMQAAVDRNRRNDRSFSYQRDAVHPDAAGHRVLAAAMIRSFEPEFDETELESPDHLAAFTERRALLKKTQAAGLTATGHLRPGVPGYRQ